MPKGLKIVGYVLLGIVSFVIFIYLTFPFDVLKGRLLAVGERSLKGRFEIKIGSISPRLVPGVTLKKVELSAKDEKGSISVIKSEKVKLKVSIFSLIFGGPKVKFDAKIGKGRINGTVNIGKDSTDVSVELEKFDLGKITYLATKYGIKLKSSISGDAKLDLDNKKFTKSTGQLKIKPNSIKVLASEIKPGSIQALDKAIEIGFLKKEDVKIPPMTIGAGKSLIAANMKRGSVKLSSFKLENGDINFDLKGVILLPRLRFNLKGNFSFSEKISEAIPFLIMIKSNRAEDGTYPLSISGRASKPQIKIGNFTVPTF